MKTYRDRGFPLLAGGLWVAFLFLDITNMADSTWVKFVGICLCCVTALFGAKTTDGRLVALALCFTVGADWFLLVRDDHYTLGVSLFIVVQLLYASRLYRLRGNYPACPGLEFRGITLILLIFGLLGRHATCGAFSPADAALPLFYFLNLCINTAEAFALGKPHRAFAWGLFLFVCCDICVGAWNLGLLPGFTRVGMWLFYLPSQVLIVLSQEQEKEAPDEKAV